MQQPGEATVGIVLAGGGSTRLASVAPTGGGKALLTFQGKTFLEHVVGSVAAEADRTIVVAAAGQILPVLDGVQIVRDSTPGAGPLAGIRDGLRAAVAVEHGEHAERSEHAGHAGHAGHAAAPPARLADWRASTAAEAWYGRGVEVAAAGADGVGVPAAGWKLAGTPPPRRPTCAAGTGAGDAGT